MSYSIWSILFLLIAVPLNVYILYLILRILKRLGDKDKK